MVAVNDSHPALLRARAEAQAAQIAAAQAALLRALAAVAVARASFLQEEEVARKLFVLGVFIELPRAQSAAPDGRPADPPSPN